MESRRETKRIAEAWVKTHMTFPYKTICMVREAEPESGGLFVNVKYRDNLVMRLLIVSGSDIRIIKDNQKEVENRLKKYQIEELDPWRNHAQNVANAALALKELERKHRDWLSEIRLTSEPPKKDTPCDLVFILRNRRERTAEIGVKLVSRHAEKQGINRTLTPREQQRMIILVSEELVPVERLREILQDRIEKLRRNISS